MERTRQLTARQSELTITTVGLSRTLVRDRRDEAGSYSFPNPLRPSTDAFDAERILFGDDVDPFNLSQCSGARSARSHTGGVNTDKHVVQTPASTFSPSLDYHFDLTLARDLPDPRRSFRSDY